MFNDDLYNVFWSAATLACYEGEGEGEGEGEAGARVKRAEEEAMKARAEADKKAEEARQAAEEAKKAQEKSFSQEDLNRFLAEDRRKHQEKYEKLETSYKQMLADKNLSEEQRGRLEGELQDLQKSFRTKEQQAEYERKQEREKYSHELTTLQETAQKWESMYKTSVIDRSLQDAAVAADAFNATQIVGLLRPMTKMTEKQDEDGNPMGYLTPMIDFPDIDEKSGKEVISLRTPEQAVQRMKELPEHYGNLFRSNVVSGVGSGSATGGAQPGEGGRIDPTNLTPEQYRRLRKENPGALGL